MYNYFFFFPDDSLETTRDFQLCYLPDIDLVPLRAWASYKVPYP